jgi:hypothetical protein
MRIKNLLIIFLAGFILMTINASDNISAAAEKEEWSPVSAGPITTWSAVIWEKGTLIVQPIFYFSTVKGTFDAEGGKQALDEGTKQSQQQQQLFVQYSLTDRLELSGQLIYQEASAVIGDATASSAGIADSYAYLRYCALKEKDNLPGITLLLQAKLPLGKYQEAAADKLETDIMGTGSYDLGYGLIMTKTLKPFLLHADFTSTLPSEVTVDNVKTEYGNYINYDLGVEYFLPKGFNLLLEMNGFWQDRSKLDGVLTDDTDSKYLLLVPGVGWSNEKIQTLVAYQFSVSGKNTNATDSLVLTMVYTF